VTHRDQNGKHVIGHAKHGDDIKLQKFRELIAKHDITYDYSDDNKRYQRGRIQFKEIRELAAEIPESKEIWNDSVRERLSRNMWQFYLW